MKTQHPLTSPRLSRRAVLSAGGLGLIAATAALTGCSRESTSSTDVASSVPAAAPASEAGGVVRIAPLQATNLLTLARQSGQAEQSLKAVGASIEWKPSFPAYAPTAEALRGGSADVGSGSATSFLSAAVGNRDLVVFAVEKDNGKSQGIVATAASGIRTIPDLVGKKVAINKGGTGEYLLRLALARHNIPFDKVQAVYLGPTEGATAFAQGHVDAWAVWEQFFAAGQAVPGARVVAYAGDIGSLNRIVHVTTRDFALKHAKLLKALFDAFGAESQASRQDPSRLAALNIKEGVPEEVAAVLRTFEAPSVVAADESIAREFDEIAQFYVSQGITAEKIAVADLLFNVLGVAS